MAMGIRCVLLGKVGSKCIHMSNRNTTSAPILFAASGGSGYSSRHPFDSGDHQNKALHRKIPKQRFDPLHHICENRCRGVGVIKDICCSAYNEPMYIAPARFAVEEFNKQKDARLQFVRLLSVTGHFLGGTRIYYLKIEAVDAADHGVVKVYQAMVARGVRDTMELRLFGLVVDNGSLLKLIDNRRTTTGKKPLDRRARMLQKTKVPTKTSGYSLGDEILSTLHMLPLQY